MNLCDEHLYYVGGVVRDEVLNLPSFDVDYCYEGNAIKFAKDKNLYILRENPAFGTVRVLYDGNEIDIASTRTEVYPKKGHLPVVANIGCSLSEDLRRRDFTINAIAKRTTDGEIIDIFDGLKDIRTKKLNVLHKESFIDDPTRIVRGLKFSVRFGFDLGDETKKIQDEYLHSINYDMSFHRLKKELVETFNLNKQEAFEKFVNQNIYKLLSSDYVYNFTKCDKISEFINNYIDKDNIWLVYLSLFDLSNIELTRSEKRILEWSNRLFREPVSNNTPKESIVINSLWKSLGIKEGFNK